jgi:hypothetical protein
MSPAELTAAFRLYAAHCIEIAQELPSPNRRATLLTMAQAWFALADQVENNGGLVVGVSPQADKS